LFFTPARSLGDVEINSFSAFCVLGKSDIVSDLRAMAMNRRADRSDRVGVRVGVSVGSVSASVPVPELVSMSGSVDPSGQDVHVRTVTLGQG
jgi:hypothetical protein